MVSWFDAVNYCIKRSEMEGRELVYSIYSEKPSINLSKSGYRLLSSAEWEWAARGGEKGHNYEYSGSDNLDEVAWYEDNSNKTTHPIMSKKPNELGIYDMSGNIWEWCWDRRGSFRVIRGGSYSSDPELCGFSGIGSNDPSGMLNDLGFRLAISFS